MITPMTITNRKKARRGKIESFGVRALGLIVNFLQLQTKKKSEEFLRENRSSKNE